MSSAIERNRTHTHTQNWTIELNRTFHFRTRFFVFKINIMFLKALVASRVYCNRRNSREMALDAL